MAWHSRSNPLPDRNMEHHSHCYSRRFLGYVYFQRKRKEKQAKAVQPQAPVREEAKEIEKQEKTAEAKYKTNKISTEECKHLTEKLEALCSARSLTPIRNLK